MELLYVWIKDYKNIKEQGFNFSPKWRFHYEPETGELTIDENKNFIDNFFGEHISNVTAIVGENGSGKSNVLVEIIRRLNRSMVEDNELTVIFNNNKIEIFTRLKINIKKGFTQKIKLKEYSLPYTFIQVENQESSLKIGKKPLSRA